MAKALSNLNVRLGFIFDQKSLAAVERQLQRTGQRLAKVGTDMSVFISAPLGLMGASAIKAAGEFESLSLAMQATFKNAGRSVGEANAEVEALRKAALAPGLDFQQAVSASIRLQSVGLSAENARDTIKELANAVASTGGTAAQLEGVTVQMAQMISKGKVLSGDLRIIQENLPIISDLMQKAFGTSNAEKIQELGITGKQFVDGITTEMSKLSRVQGGISNALVNAGSAIKQALGEIGAEIAKTFNITSLSDKFAAGLSSMVDWFKNLSDGTKKTIVIIGSMLAALGPLVAAFGALNSVAGLVVGAWGSVMASGKNVAAAVQQVVAAVSAMNVATQAFIGIGLAVAIAAIAYNMGAFSKELSITEKAQAAVNDVQREALSNIASEKSQVETLITVINSEVSSREAKQRALDKLADISPQYFGQLKIENGIVNGLTDSYNKYVTALLNSARAEAAKGKLVEIERQLLDLEDQRAAKLAEGQKVSAFALGSAAGAAEKEAIAYGKTIAELNAKKSALAAIVVSQEQANVSSNSAVVATNSETVSRTALTKATKEHAQALKDQAAEDYAQISRLEATKAIVDGIAASYAAMDQAALDAANADAAARAASVGATDTTSLAPTSGGQALAGGGFAPTTSAQPLELGFNMSDVETVAAMSAAFNTLNVEQEKSKLQFEQIGIAADGISAIGGALSDALMAAGGSFKDFAKSAISAIGDVIGKLIQLAVANAFTGALKEGAKFGPIGVAIAAVTGGLAAVVFKKLVGAAKFAKGTKDAPGGLSLVGEAGPELVNLPRHSQVYPAGKTRSMLAGGLGGASPIQLAGEFTVSGDSLRLVLDRANSKQLRVT